MADETSAKVVYFVRHGQSEDNVAPVFQSPDSPLSAVGRNQAARIAARVATLAFDVWPARIGAPTKPLKSLAT